MTEEHKIILTIIQNELTKNPYLRFGQVLSNLNINQFKNMSNPAQENYSLRDIYYDQDDEILKRIQSF